MRVCVLPALSQRVQQTLKTWPHADRVRGRQLRSAGIARPRSLLGRWSPRLLRGGLQQQQAVGEFQVQVMHGWPPSTDLNQLRLQSGSRGANVIKYMRPDLTTTSTSDQTNDDVKKLRHTIWTLVGCTLNV